MKRILLLLNYSCCHLFKTGIRFNDRYYLVNILIKSHNALAIRFNAIAIIPVVKIENNGYFLIKSSICNIFGLHIFFNSLSNTDITSSSICLVLNSALQELHKIGFSVL